MDEYSVPAFESEVLPANREWRVPSDDMSVLNNLSTPTKIKDEVWDDADVYDHPNHSDLLHDASALSVVGQSAAGGFGTYGGPYGSAFTDDAFDTYETSVHEYGMDADEDRDTSFGAVPAGPSSQEMPAVLAPPPPVHVAVKVVVVEEEEEEEEHENDDGEYMTTRRGRRVKRHPHGDVAMGDDHTHAGTAAAHHARAGRKRAHKSRSSGGGGSGGATPTGRSVATDRTHPAYRPFYPVGLKQQRVYDIVLRDTRVPVEQMYKCPIAVYTYDTSVSPPWSAVAPHTKTGVFYVFLVLLEDHDGDVRLASPKAPGPHFGVKRVYKKTRIDEPLTCGSHGRVRFPNLQILCSNGKIRYRVGACMVYGNTLHYTDLRASPRLRVSPKMLHGASQIAENERFNVARGGRGGGHPQVHPGFRVNLLQSMRLPSEVYTLPDVTHTSGGLVVVPKVEHLLAEWTSYTVALDSCPKLVWPAVEARDKRGGGGGGGGGGGSKKLVMLDESDECSSDSDYAAPTKRAAVPAPTDGTGAAAGAAAASSSSSQRRARPTASSATESASEVDDASYYENEYSEDSDFFATSQEQSFGFTPGMAARKSRRGRSRKGAASAARSPHRTAARKGKKSTTAGNSGSGSNRSRRSAGTGNGNGKARARSSTGPKAIPDTGAFDYDAADALDVVPDTFDDPAGLSLSFSFGSSSLDVFSMSMGQSSLGELSEPPPTATLMSPEEELRRLRAEIQAKDQLLQAQEMQAQGQQAMYQQEAVNFLALEPDRTSDVHHSLYVSPCVRIGQAQITHISDPEMLHHVRFRVVGGQQDLPTRVGVDGGLEVLIPALGRPGTVYVQMFLHDVLCWKLQPFTFLDLHQMLAEMTVEDEGGLELARRFVDSVLSVPTKRRKTSDHNRRTSDASHSGGGSNAQYAEDKRVAIVRETIEKLSANSPDFDVADFVNLRDERGRTFLHTVAEHGTRDLARLLLSYGAMPLVRDVDCHSALDVARRVGNDDVAQCIKLRAWELRDADVDADDVHVVPGDAPADSGAGAGAEEEGEDEGEDVAVVVVPGEAPSTDAAAGGDVAEVAQVGTAAAAVVVARESEARGDDVVHFVWRRKRGWLWKTYGALKIWKKRYFVLNKTTLEYYADEQCQEPIASIALVDVDGVRHGHFHKPNPFEIVTARRTYLLSARTRQERSDWMSAIIHNLGYDLHTMGGRVVMRSPVLSPVVDEARSRRSSSAASDPHAEARRVCGYLVKAFGFVRLWKRRFCVLDGEKLVYYDDHECKTKVRTIALTTECTVRTSGVSKVFSFVLDTPERKFYFSAATPEQRRLWMDALEHNLALLRHTAVRREQLRQRGESDSADLDNFALSAEEFAPSPAVRVSHLQEAETSAAASKPSVKSAGPPPSKVVSPLKPKTVLVVTPSGGSGSGSGGQGGQGGAALSHADDAAAAAKAAQFGTSATRGASYKDSFDSVGSVGKAGAVDALSASVKALALQDSPDEQASQLVRAAGAGGMLAF